MVRSYYAARANLYSFWQQHPDWTVAQLAAALGGSEAWVKKWLKGFREQLAAGVPLEHLLQGIHEHARARFPRPIRCWSSRSSPLAISLPKACGASPVNKPFTTTLSAIPCSTSSNCLFLHARPFPASVMRQRSHCSAQEATVDPDGWLIALDGLHLSRKVDRHGMLSVDLKRYYVSSGLPGQHVDLHLDAKGRCLQVLHEQHIIKSLPLKGMVGHWLSFEQFLAHLLHQARAQARLRSLQERKYRTAALASP